MNLALHGLMLQVIVSMVGIQNIFRVCSAGEPGYLDFDNLPETNFSCQGKVIGGYYADVEAGCQMFHVCTIGQKDEIMDIKFLCLNGTVFDQETRVCERVDEVDCSKSERFYNLNLELYGNNAVTLSLQEGSSSSESESSTNRQESPHSFYTSTRPSVVTTTVTTTTTTTTPRPTSSTAPNKNFRHPSGFQHQYYDQDNFQPTVPSIYNDKHDDYRHQYVYHNSDRNNKNNQATSYQLFSNNQPHSSTTSANQIQQQLRYSQSAPPVVSSFTISPLGHGTSTVQSLLKAKNTGPSLINPIFHNHALTAGSGEFAHNNSPRETLDYDDDEEEEEDVDDNEEEDVEGREAEKTQMKQEQNHGRRNMERKPLEPVQSSNQGKVSKLSLSPISQQESTNPHVVIHSEEPRITLKFLKPTTKPSQLSTTFPTVIGQKVGEPHQVKLNQRVAQNPPPLLPSQSRVIVTAKASVSDESGRPLNTSQIIALPTVPSNYDDYKEGDESFDPFYKDVPKIHNQHITKTVRVNQDRSGRKKRSAVRVRVIKINAKRNDLRLRSTMPTRTEKTPAERNNFRNRTGNKKSNNLVGFNCLDKELYRFYSDSRDCRLFHYCSPGFTNRQVLDFRFVCEEGTLFDETSQSCRFADCKKRL